MANEAAYCCAALLFLVLIVLFSVSMRTNSQTRKYCQPNNAKKCETCKAYCSKDPGAAICHGCYHFCEEDS